MRAQPSPFLGGRSLAEVYVEPDVLVVEERSADEPDEPDEQQESPGAPPVLRPVGRSRAPSRSRPASTGPEVADPDEDSVRTSQERRVAWPELLVELGAGAHGTVVLEGPQGAASRRSWP